MRQQPPQMHDGQVKPVSIHSRVLEQMIRHARQEAPLECCGLLSGVDEAIDRAHPVPNQTRSRTEFSVAPTELFSFFKRLRGSGRRHLGIYHSHPVSSCLPSARDVAEFHYPAASYWIISLQEESPRICCYLWQEGGFRGTEFQVEPPGEGGRSGVAVTSAKDWGRLDGGLWTVPEAASKPTAVQKDVPGQAVDSLRTIRATIEGVEKIVVQPDIFARLRPWAPEELLTFLDHTAVLLPDEFKHRLKQVIDSVPPEGDNMHKVLELVRSQWKEIQSSESVQIAVVGPGQTGKNTLVDTIGSHQEEGTEAIFTVVETPGLEEFLGYESGDLSELERSDVVLLVLDGQYELSSATRQLYEGLLGLGRPVLVVLNKMDLVERPWRALRRARTTLGTGVFSFSVLQPHSADTLLKAIVDAEAKTFVPLSRAFPKFRRSICNGIVGQAALAAAVVGAVSIPVSQFLPITAIQTGMLLKIARAFGYPLSRERARELLPMLVLGAAAREAGHRLRARFPDYKKVISVSVAGLWTLTLGQAAIRYFKGLQDFWEGESFRLSIPDTEEV